MSIYTKTLLIARLVLLLAYCATLVFLVERVKVLATPQDSLGLIECQSLEDLDLFVEFPGFHCPEGYIAV
jgi:hypothetical protein